MKLLILLVAMAIAETADQAKARNYFTELLHGGKSVILRGETPEGIPCGSEISDKMFGTFFVTVYPLSALADERLHRDEFVGVVSSAASAKFAPDHILLEAPHHWGNRSTRNRLEFILKDGAIERVIGESDLPNGLTCIFAQPYAGV